VPYAFDTSGNHQGGEGTGPEVISRQIAGRTTGGSRPGVSQQNASLPGRRARLATGTT
jgi:hypothetical protein